MFGITAYSPDNLSSLLSEAEDKGIAPSYETADLNWDEMLNFAPASMMTQYPNPAPNPPLQGFGVAQTFSPVWYVLAAATLGYIFFVRQPHHF